MVEKTRRERNCIMCGAALSGNQKKFCSISCRKEGDSSLVKSVWEQDTGEKGQERWRRNSLHEMAARALENGRSYGKEVLQEYLAVQSKELAKSKTRICAMIQQKQVEQKLYGYGERR